MVVTTHNKETLKEMEALGAKTVTCGREVAEEADDDHHHVPNSPQVREVALGEGGIIEGGKEGSVLIDMSSIDPTESKAISAELAKKGIDMLDAPVSGGEPKAIDGTISVMVGGKKETFDKYYDLMMAMAGSVVYVGPIGSGNVAKLANQIIVAVNIAAVSEALTLAKKAGTDPELVYQAIRGGLAGSTVLDAKAPMMMDRNFKPGSVLNFTQRPEQRPQCRTCRKRTASADRRTYGDHAGTQSRRTRKRRSFQHCKILRKNW